ncbi:hypothetical protein RchiOBHm_Chr2g0147271 [Rosa chinensis]|uniref:Uncharacterized protein n=1 Tax=Rosa chinensis TaxID=74649 RepID=A0A2P6RZ36_ROSCH|nr:hypothetical protein RchiOBHm_Chr2g0147271 [Rosa chinensis]
MHALIDSKFGMKMGVLGPWLLCGLLLLICIVEGHVHYYDFVVSIPISCPVFIVDMAGPERSIRVVQANYEILLFHAHASSGFFFFVSSQNSAVRTQH